MPKPHKHQKPDTDLFFDHARFLIQAGYLSLEQVMEEIQAPAHLDEMEEQGIDSEELLEQLTLFSERMMAKQLAEEADLDKSKNRALDAAFLELAAAGIITGQNMGYTIDDGWADMNEMAHELQQQGRPPRGAVFFHGQDLARAMEGHSLLLAFDAYSEGSEEEHTATSEEIGREVMATLSRHGLRTEWSGREEDRIKLEPFRWCRDRSSLDITFGTGT